MTWSVEVFAVPARTCYKVTNTGFLSVCLSYSILTVAPGSSFAGCIYERVQGTAEETGALASARVHSPTRLALSTSELITKKPARNCSLALHFSQMINTTTFDFSFCSVCVKISTICHFGTSTCVIIIYCLKVNVPIRVRVCVLVRW